MSDEIFVESDVSQPLLMSFTDVAVKTDGTYVVTVSGSRCHVTTDYNQPLYLEVKAYLAKGGSYHKYAEDISVETDQQVLAKIWVDEMLVQSDALASQYRDDVDLGLLTAFSKEQFIELLAWRKALRAWTQSEGYPSHLNRPMPPGWLPPLSSL